MRRSHCVLLFLLGGLSLALSSYVLAAILASDLFNRANETPLAAPWSRMTAISGTTMNLATNAVVPVSLTNTAMYLYTGTFPDDQYAQAVITATGGTNFFTVGPGVMVRASGTNNFYATVAHKTGTNISLEKYVAGTQTVLWTRSTTWANGDTIRLEAQGSTLRVKFNGVQLGADTTDTSLTTGNPGIVYHGHSSVTAATIDTWEAGDFPGAGVARRRVIAY